MKKIVIIGAGESGIGASVLAQKEGFDVFVSDFGTISTSHKEELKSLNISFEEGGHSIDLILEADEIIKSPGVPENMAVIQQARQKGISVISEIEFASRYTDAKIIALTGSNGKTTTTLLTYHFLKSAGFNVGLAGNIGESFARKVATQNHAYYVLELSSFQLDGCYDFKPKVAVLLNITPDHLDRYENSFDLYAKSKFRIAQNQDFNDYFISFIDSEEIQEEMPKHQINAFRLAVSLKNKMLNGAYLSDDRLMININNHFTSVFSVDKHVLPLFGEHNMINTMSAIMASLAVGVTEEQVIKSIGQFENAPHRLEDVAVINGVRYINDSKATNVDAVKYALDSFEKPIIWIVGGIDKGNDYSLIEEAVYEKVKTVICLGKDNEKLKAFFHDKVPTILESESMKETVKIANELSQAGDHVLLSPACASFDLFNNYEDRGDQFKEAVSKLNRNKSSISSIVF